MAVLVSLTDEIIKTFYSVDEYKITSISKSPPSVLIAPPWGKGSFYREQVVLSDWRTPSWWSHDHSEQRAAGGFQTLWFCWRSENKELMVDLNHQLQGSRLSLLRRPRSKLQTTLLKTPVMSVHLTCSSLLYCCIKCGPCWV